MRTPRKDIKLARYQDPDGLTLEKMNIGLWFVENRRRIFTLITIFLIVSSAIFWGYTLFGITYYVLVGMKQDRELADSLVVNNLVGHEYFLSIAPKRMQVESVEVLESNNGYDFYAVIKNPNENHIGFFTYRFLADGNETTALKGYIFPGKTKYILNLGEDLAVKPQTARLLLNESWMRLDKHNYPDWQAFYSERINFKISGAEFIPAKSTILSEKLNLNQVNFDITNHSAYNYRLVDLVILLKQLDRVVGINQYRVNDLYSGETDTVSLTWPGRLGRIDDVIVIPDADITDNGNYLDF